MSLVHNCGSNGSQLWFDRLTAVVRPSRICEQISMKSLKKDSLDDFVILSDESFIRILKKCVTLQPKPK